MESQPQNPEFRNNRETFHHVGMRSSILSHAAFHLGHHFLAKNLFTCIKNEKD